MIFCVFPSIKKKICFFFLNYTKLLIFLFTSICLIFIINFYPTSIVYAEELVPKDTNSLIVNPDLSIEELARFAKTTLGPLAKQQELGIPLTSSGKPDSTHLVILGSELHFHKHDTHGIYINVSEFIKQKNFVLTDQYVGDAENFNALRYYYHKDQLIQCHEKLGTDLRVNTDGHNKIVSTVDIAVDNKNPFHKQTTLEYTAPEGEKFRLQYTLTTNPVKENTPTGFYFGADLKKNYAHVYNSPLIDLDPKEKDTYVQLIPKGVYMDNVEITKYQTHFGNKILELQKRLDLLVYKNETEQIYHLHNKELNNKQLKHILLILNLIPIEMEKITAATFEQLRTVPMSVVHQLVYETLTNIPKTKIKVEAQPVFDTILNQLREQKITPPLYNLNIPNFQFSSIPQNYAFNSNSILSFKTTNYTFLMKTIARIQQLM